jgi:hypothetical protein
MVLEVSAAHSSKYQTPIVAKPIVEVDDADNTAAGALGASELIVRDTHALVEGCL